MAYRNLRMTPKIIIPVAVALLGVLLVLAWQVQSRSSEAILALAKQELMVSAQAQSNKYMDSVNLAFDGSQMLGASFSEMLRQNRPAPRETAIALIQGALLSNKMLVSTAAYFEPDGYDGQDAENLNGPGSGPDGRFAFTVTAGKTITRTDFQTEPYWTETKARRSNFATDPFESDYIPGLWISISAVPIIVDGKFRGVVTSSLSINKIREDILNYKTYASGFGLLVTQKGTVIAHHDSSFLQKNIFDQINFGNNHEILAAMSRGEPYFTQYDRGDGIQRFIYFAPFELRNTGQYWYFVANAPVGEVLASANRITLVTLGLSLAALLAVITVIYVVVRTSVKPIGELAAFSGEITKGNLGARIRDASYGGEVKDLSDSLKKMVGSLIKNLEEQKRNQELEAERSRQAQETAASVSRLTEEFRATSTHALEAADQAVEALSEMAVEMQGASNILNQQTAAVASGAEQATTNVEKVASAAEELSASIREIGHQVEQSNQMSARAVNEAQATNEIIQGLLGESGSIGEVVKLINDIASQTNLLALNATIEAARAGEAGKGFAVVANEVKNLANQTAKATEEIGSQIGAVQASTREAVEAISKIVGRITENSHVAAAIAAAVEEQAAATAEIANSVQQAAAGTQDVSASIAQAALAASSTGQTADRVMQSSEDLGARSDTLKTGVVDFIKNLETALRIGT